MASVKSLRRRKRNACFSRTTRASRRPENTISLEIHRRSRREFPQAEWITAKKRRDPAVEARVFLHREYDDTRGAISSCPFFDDRRNVSHPFARNLFFRHMKSRKVKSSDLSFFSRLLTLDIWHMGTLTAFVFLTYIWSPYLNPYTLFEWFPGKNKMLIKDIVYNTSKINWIEES